MGPSAARRRRERAQRGNQRPRRRRRRAQRGEGVTEKLAERLQAALSAEHSAIFAYARLGVLLDKAGQKEARTGEEMHRTRRDALLVQLAELKVTAPVAQA